MKNLLGQTIMEDFISEFRDLGATKKRVAKFRREDFELSKLSRDQQGQKQIPSKEVLQMVHYVTPT
jgi:hypothetical protein